MKYLFLGVALALLLAGVASAQTAPPVLGSIGAQSVNENELLTVNVSATDVDGTIAALTTSTLPTGAVFNDAGDNSGTLTWTPDFSQAGTFNVTFYAADTVTTDVDSEVVAITVTNVNQEPVLAVIGAQSVNENELLTINVSASDADGTTPSFSTSTLPTGAGFVDNSDGTGALTWTPDFIQAGGYSVTFYTTDGTATDSEVVAITVTNVNQEPVLAVIGAQSVNENELLTINVSASDADGTTPSFSTSTLPTGAGFVDNSDGTGALTWTPDFTQAGGYSVTFYTTDGTATDSEVVAITVTNVNQEPVLAVIGAQSVNENELLTINVSASDADGTTPSFSTSTLPTGAGFVDNSDGTGALTWTPDFTQAGGYSVTFYTTDGTATDSEVVAITVTNVNQEPVLAVIGAQSVNENELLTINVSASDADGTTPSFSTSTLPTGAGFVDNSDGTGALTWTPDFTQAGGYSVTFYTTDGTATDSEVVAITVTNVNQEPVLAVIGAQSVNENELLTINVSASDADGTTPSFSTSTLPTGAGFVDNSDGTGALTWTPDFTQAGGYSVTFYTTDGTATDSEVVAITVTNVNQEPVLAVIGAQSVNENELLTINVSASDADGTTPSFSTSTLPTGAGFVDNSDGTGALTWTPDFTQAGGYSVTFYTTDGTATDSEVVAITVTNVNQEPVLAVIGVQSVTEGDALNLVIAASDADGNIPTITSSALPTNATFLDNGDGTADFDFNPTFLQSGGYSVTFYTTDGVATDSEVVAITVVEAGNQDPVLASIGAQGVNEGNTLAFTVSATDIEGALPSLSTSVLPTNASFVDNGDGTGDFSFTPAFQQSGAYQVTFTATDDSSASTSEIVTITVNDAGNQAPVLGAIGARTVAEGAALNFGVAATDPDGTTPTLSTSALPTNATFVDNGNGFGSFSFTPDYTQEGAHNVTFYATDGSASDSEVVVITVTDAGNQPPVLAEIGPQVVTEGGNLNLVITATDADATTPTFTTSALPTNATFVDNGDGSGTFDFNPDFVQAGILSVTFRATDGAVVDSEVVFITINDAGNQDPTLAAIGAQSVTEGNTLVFATSASDPEGAAPALSTSALPTNATYVDNGDGTGDFSFTPDFTQANSYDITFSATDDSGAVVSEMVTVTVNEAGNQDPVLAAIGAQGVDENVTLAFTITSTDPDATFPALTTSALPTNASFVDNGDGTGDFSFTPDFFQAGTHSVTFVASDGTVSDSEVVEITVNNINRDPELAAIGAQVVDENGSLAFTVTASDLDLTALTLSTSVLPTNATFVDNGDGTADFAFNPDYYQAGTYDVTFYVSDGEASDSELVVITVNPVNQLPILDPIGAQFADEGGNLNLLITASDADGTPLTLTTSALPPNATFVDNGDGTADFDFNPDYTQADIISLTFYVSDGVASDSELVFITINEAGNQIPVLSPIGPRSTSESVNLNFAISATDADGTSPTLTAENLPTGANFTDNGSGNGTFDWTPTFDQEGAYDVTFIASDGAAADSELVTITVGGANQTPIADAGMDQANVPAGILVTLDGSGSYDPDGGAPTGYAWLQVGGTTVTLSSDTDVMPTFTPTVVDVYVFELTVNDGVATSTPDTVSVSVITGAPPAAITDLGIQIVGDDIQLSWSAVTLDTTGTATTLDRYVVYRGTTAFFTPTSVDSIGFADPGTLTFTDNNLGAADVVGDVNENYFYVVAAVDFMDNPGAISNRVGEFDYQLVTTATSDYNLVGIPFANTGITDADGLIAAIGASNVLTVNNYIAASQSFESRFAAGFGTNFAVTTGGVYQVNAAAGAVFSVAGSVPDAGTVSYGVITTATTSFCYLMIPFDREGDFAVAQDVIDNIPGVLNTLNNFIAGSQNYESRFSAGFGVNFTVRAGMPYQGNVAAAGTFPAP